MVVDEKLCGIQEANIPSKSAIYIWGYNESGQTARKGNLRHLRIPKSLSSNLFNISEGKRKKNLHWLDVACGREHTAAVASDGSLYTWGQSTNLFFIVCFYSCF